MLLFWEVSAVACADFEMAPVLVLRGRRGSTAKQNLFDPEPLRLFLATG
jgi:hypothetical protein